MMATPRLPILFAALAFAGAARALAISRASLHRKMNRLDLQRPSRDA